MFEKLMRSVMLAGTAAAVVLIDWCLFVVAHHA